MKYLLLHHYVHQTHFFSLFSETVTILIFLCIEEKKYPSYRQLSSVNSTTDHYTITDLQPSTNYTVRLQARAGGNDLNVTESDSVVTLPQGN